MPDKSVPDYAPVRILETLREHHVKFVLVGGEAATQYGASRQTQDADLVVEFSPDNLSKLSAALDELHWRYRIEGLDDGEAQRMTRGQSMHPQVLERGSIHTFMTDAGAVDILRMIPTQSGETPGRSYAELAATALSHQVLPGLIVKLAALDHIIESKQWAARAKDQAALPELLELQAKQLAATQIDAAQDDLER